jgi:transposase-like protein
MPAPRPPEFRRRAVELSREKAAPIAQIAKDLGISGSCLRNWLACADVDEAREGGLSSGERKELVVCAISSGLRPRMRSCAGRRHRSPATPSFQNDLFSPRPETGRYWPCAKPVLVTIANRGRFGILHPGCSPATAGCVTSSP